MRDDIVLQISIPPRRRQTPDGDLAHGTLAIGRCREAVVGGRGPGSLGHDRHPIVTGSAFAEVGVLEVEGRFGEAVLVHDILPITQWIESIET